MNVLELAKEALELMQQGRQQLASVVDAVRDGKAALSTTDLSELNVILAKEKTETEAAHNALDRAIQAAQSN